MAKTNPIPLNYRLNIDNAFNPTAHQYGWMPATPSEWFAVEYPDVAADHGCPFLESHSIVHDQVRVEPVEMNDDFFAMLLKGDADLNHHVVFYEPDHTFYFRDGDQYHPTTEAKLKNLLSALLMKCASQMPRSVDLKRLFIEFRQDKRLQMIVVKARSMLAADATFFSVDSPNHRANHTDEVAVARRFIDTQLIINPPATLTLSTAYHAFQQFCNDNHIVVFNRRQFVDTAGKLIKQEFGLGMRHDLVDQGRSCHGWRGLELEKAVKTTSTTPATDDQTADAMLN